jgi:hypothetical protein
VKLEKNFETTTKRTVNTEAGRLYVLVNSKEFDATKPLKVNLNFKSASSIVFLAYLSVQLEDRIKMEIEIEKDKNNKFAFAKVENGGCFFKNGGVFFKVINTNAFTEEKYLYSDIIDDMIDTLVRKTIIDNNVVEIRNKNVVETYKNVPFDFSCILNKQQRDGEFSCKINNVKEFKFADDPFRIYINEKKIDIKNKKIFK